MVQMSRVSAKSEAGMVSERYGSDGLDDRELE